MAQARACQIDIAKRLSWVELPTLAGHKDSYPDGNTSKKNCINFKSLARVFKMGKMNWLTLPTISCGEIFASLRRAGVLAVEAVVGGSLGSGWAGEGLFGNHAVELLACQQAELLTGTVSIVDDHAFGLVDTEA